MLATLLAVLLGGMAIEKVREPGLLADYKQSQAILAAALELRTDVASAIDDAASTAPAVDPSERTIVRAEYGRDARQAAASLNELRVGEAREPALRQRIEEIAKLGESVLEASDANESREMVRARARQFNAAIDPFIVALRRTVLARCKAYDSARTFLQHVPYDSIDCTANARRL